jgi:hypothetical protein
MSRAVRSPPFAASLQTSAARAAGPSGAHRRATGSRDPVIRTERPRSALLARCAAVAALAAVAADGAGAQPAVRVTREPPVVTRTEVDVLRRPPNVPVFGPYESGQCNSTFEIQTSIGYTVEPAGRRTLRLVPTSIEAVTRLKLDIFTLAGGPPKLYAHEEAHRQISEYYYEDAAVIARSLGTSLIGKAVIGTGATRAAAEKSAFDELVSGYNEAYFARTRARAYAANERFDEITDHGRHPIEEADAIARAIAPDP